MSFLLLVKCVGAFISPKGILLYANVPIVQRNAVLGMSLVCIGIW